MVDFALTTQNIAGFIAASGGFGTFTLDVTSMGITTRTDFDLSVAGTAVLTLTGYDPTPTRCGSRLPAGRAA